MSSVKLLGLARIRQVRVRRQNDSSQCHVEKLFKTSIPCTPKFSSSLEEKMGAWNQTVVDASMTAFDYVEESNFPTGHRVAQWAGE